MEIETDSKMFTINIIVHGDIKVQNLVAPSAVESGEAFGITYDAVNQGEADDFYGFITNDIDNSEIPNTRWTGNILAGETRACSATLTITDTLNATIHVGYNKP